MTDPPSAYKCLGGSQWLRLLAITCLGARRSLIVIALTGVWHPLAAQTEPGQSLQPELGQFLKPEQLSSLTIFADGRGLPPGVGTVPQGELLYADHCMACHGKAHDAGFDKGLNDALSGGHAALDEVPALRTIGSYWPYAPAVFDYIRRAMPYNAAGLLSDQETYSVVAFLLYKNGLMRKDEVLDRARLASIQMPARPRFFSRYPLP